MPVVYHSVIFKLEQAFFTNTYHHLSYKIHTEGKGSWNYLRLLLENPSGDHPHETGSRRVIKDQEV